MISSRLTRWFATSALCLCASFSQAEIKHERVLDPTIPGGIYKHPATIEELPNGDLFIAYYGGEGEYKGDTAVYGSRLVKGSDQWTTPERIADTPDRADGNGVIWASPDGITWLFYVVRYGDTWSDSIIKYKYSKDNGHTWTDSEILTFDKGMMVRSQPIALNNGDYLLPIYHETGNDREIVGAESGSLFARLDPETMTWKFTDIVHSRMGNIQPSVVQVNDDHLIAYCRRGGGYGLVPDGFVVKTESHDGGHTWTPGEDTIYPNPNSAVDLIKLENGHLMFVYNNSFEGRRMPLVVRVSTDNGKTWPHSRIVVNKPEDSAAYPYFIQGKDGKIHLVYTSERRTVVNHMTFEESDILGHEEVK
ncbi:MAG: exo-alpha-sialidase [Planctomycetaceae bacterium]|nr:exo-alpha-sialidase [Planctomycetaceae bacterium]